MPLKIIRNDITKMPVDAIVNAANTSLKMGGGVCGAIFSAAGTVKLQEECDLIGRCNTGQAVITSAYSLPSKYIVHAVGPIWRGGGSGEASLLHLCYTNSLVLALEHDCQSIAFPLISSGIYGYPKDKALQIAISAIGEFLLKHDITVYLVVYDKKSFVLSEKLFDAIEKYIDDNYVEEHMVAGSSILEPYKKPVRKVKRKLEDVIGQLDEPFAQMLLRLIDEKGLTDVQTYKKANMDRKLFSKIRSSKSYNPSKITSIALAIALELNLDETRDLLNKAGFSLSHSNKFDVIIEYFIEEGNYNIYEINEALFAFEQVLLGS
ncbi:MAG: macro domain-containing protein [Desulfosporosinus sp.]|nr:macro domain-containing protein [Desulfosporosinus sp.]